MNTKEKFFYWGVISVLLAFFGVITAVAKQDRAESQREIALLENVLNSSTEEIVKLDSLLQQYQAAMSVFIPKMSHYSFEHGTKALLGNSNSVFLSEEDRRELEKVIISVSHDVISYEEAEMNILGILY